jgi:hypothetical protein
MSLYFWITFGSALGGLARFVLPGLTADHIGKPFAWETMVGTSLASSCAVAGGGERFCAAANPTAAFAICIIAVWLRFLSAAGLNASKAP